MFDGLFVVLVVAALVPLRWASSRRSRSPGPLPRPAPPARSPGPVLEMVLGTVIGPSVLGWVHHPC
jgi:hypothetical protein